MKVFEYQTWRAAAVAYWEAKIDQEVDDAGHTGLGFKDQLKTELYAFMDTLDPVFNAYANDDTRRGPFIDVLLALYNYAVSAYLIVTPEVPVPSLSILPNGVVTDLFAWFTEDLPPYENLFEVVFTEDPLAVPPTVTAELVDVEFSGVVTTVGNYLSDDMANIEGITNQIVAAVRERAAYIVFADDANIVRNDGTAKEILLNDFRLLDVLNEFGWTVKGINA